MDAERTDIGRRTAVTTVRARILSPGRTPRRILIILTAVLVGAALVFGTVAKFTVRAANPANTFSSGTLSLSDSDEGAAILTATGMKPGDNATGRVDIENTGSVAGTLRLSRPALEDSDPANPLSRQLQLVVSDCGSFNGGPPNCDGVDPVVYRGTLADMTGTSALGTFVPAEKHRYEFMLAFDPAAGNAYQDATSTATFRWDATQ